MKENRLKKLNSTGKEAPEREKGCTPNELGKGIEGPKKKLLRLGEKLLTKSQMIGAGTNIRNNFPEKEGKLRGSNVQKSVGAMSLEKDLEQAADSRHFLRKRKTVKREKGAFCNTDKDWAESFSKKNLQPGGKSPLPKMGTGTGQRG